MHNLGKGYCPYCSCSLTLRKLCVYTVVILSIFMVNNLISNSDSFFYFKVKVLRFKLRTLVKAPTVMVVEMTEDHN